jgi:hypothetical protein
MPGSLPAFSTNFSTHSVCVPALDSNTITCGTTVPQGAPWIFFRVNDITDDGEKITLTAACTFTSLTYRRYWCTDVEVTNAGFAPGEQTVVVTDTATGTELARATYTVVPQTPEQALAAFRGGHSTWARSGTVLALARSGQLDQALAAAQAMQHDSDLFTQYEGYWLGVSVLLAERRPAEAERLGEDLIAWRRTHGQKPQMGDYVLLARAALAACDISTAEAALGRASLLAPGAPVVTRLLVEVEAAAAGACAMPGVGPMAPIPPGEGGGESQ